MVEVSLLLALAPWSVAAAAGPAHHHLPAYGPGRAEAAGDCGMEGGVWVAGLAAILVFYLLVVIVGAAATIAEKSKTGKGGATQEQVMLGGRDLGLCVGVLTMGATWVGGGFINGSAQSAYTRGLVWTVAPFGYSLSLVIGGTFFAKRMREARYVTVIDPFMQKYGKWGGLMVLPAAVSEIFWSASILAALGSTLHVVLHIDDTVSIVLSAGIALLYTMFGGLVAVAYTDVVQIIFIVVGLFVALPCALLHPAVGDIYAEKLEDGLTPAWYGKVESHQWGEWVDSVLLCLCGGVPWQCYFQRVLSAQSGPRAAWLSYGGAAIALIMTGPAVLFGAIARSTDWSLTAYSCASPDPRLVLPLALKYLTPPVVAWFGLGAVSAAVMSSTDSSLLSASSLLARNLYHKVFRPSAYEREVVVALRCFILLTCLAATLLALRCRSIYGLFVLCGDFMYVIVFPQLVLVLFWPPANTYGSVAAFLASLALRVAAGEATLGMPALITLGTYSTACAAGTCTGPLPFRTIIMLAGLAVHLAVSQVTHSLFTSCCLGLRFDLLNCYMVDEQAKYVYKVVLKASTAMEAPATTRGKDQWTNLVNQM